MVQPKFIGGGPDRSDVLHDVFRSDGEVRAQKSTCRWVGSRVSPGVVGRLKVFSIMLSSILLPLSSASWNWSQSPCSFRSPAMMQLRPVGRLLSSSVHGRYVLLLMVVSFLPRRVIVTASVHLLVPVSILL